MSNVLVLHVCDPDGLSYGGFQWPESGPVECPPPDPNNPGAHWDPKPTCGNGLHGWLWGEGNGLVTIPSPKARWLVVEVLESDIVDLGGKVKFPKGYVIFCGRMEDAANYIANNGGLGRVIIGQQVSKLTGAHNIAVVGDYGSAIVGNHGTALAGSDGLAIAGQCGRAISGFGGTAIAGTYGNAQASVSGTASAGYGGQAYVGNMGKASAGEYGRIVIEDFVAGSFAGILVGNIGKKGILPNTYYMALNGRLRACGSCKDQERVPKTPNLVTGISFDEVGSTS